MNWEDYPNFTEDEFRCKCGCGRADMDPVFMNRLQLVRSSVAFGFPVTSGFRCDEYDKSIGGKGVHPTGKAVDLHLYGEQAFAVQSIIERFGIYRIGLKQHGSRQNRFIHLDCVDDPDHPSPWVWTY